MSEPPGAMTETILFADHFEARQMGDHVREIRFVEPVVLNKIQVLGRSEKTPESSFEGKSFPNVRTMSLSVYAVNRLAASSTLRLLGDVGTFHPADLLVTDCVIIRGQYLRLSVVVFGHVPVPGEVPALCDDDLTGVAAHLRPTTPYDPDKLDLANFSWGRDVYEELIKEMEADVKAEATVMPSMVAGDVHVAEHALWVESLESLGDVEGSVARLDSLSRDLASMSAVGADSSALVTSGPALGRALLALIARCTSRFELRPLRAALHALAAALCAATTAAEVTKRGGLAQVLAIVRDSETQSNLKLAGMLVLLRLCSHAVGMEAFLGWSSAGDDSAASQGYETVVSIAADGAAPRLEQAAVALLKRSSFYMSLARLDNSCADDDETPVDVSASMVDALTDVAEQFEELSWCSKEAGSFLEDDGTLGDVLQGFSDPGLPSRAADPFLTYPQFHGFMESFLSARRLVPGLCLLFRRLPRLSPRDRLAVFAPLRRLICALLACVGGAKFLSSDAAALTTLRSLMDAECKGTSGKTSGDGSGLPPVPRFPEPLVRCALGASQLAALVGMHVRAMQLTMILITRTRQRGHDGLLQETEALPFLCTLHRLAAKGAAGRDAVFCAFRSVLHTEWLWRQFEGRLETGQAAPQPSLRHLVAIMHAVVLADPTASVAERWGARMLGIATQVLELLESGQGDDNWGASLEFALDSEPEGGLGCAVRGGRRSADQGCLSQLRELVAQLQFAETTVTTARLLSSVRLTKAPRAFKRSTTEERGSRLTLFLGGYSGVDGVEVAEVDFSGDAADHETPDERFPPCDELPLLSMRLLCRRAANIREGLGIVLTEDKRPGESSTRDGLAVLVPILIRCASAFNLNLEAVALQEDKEAINDIYATQFAHAQLLEATLQTCYHVFQSLRDAGLAQYRHAELLNALFLLTDRLTSNFIGVPGAGDPEFRLLLRHCLVWVCRLFRAWVQSFPAAFGGQLLQPLLRHMRVLPSHFVSGLLLLSTCGSLAQLLPTSPHSFSFGLGAPTDAANEQCIHSKVLSLPSSTRGGTLGHVILKTEETASSGDRSKMWGQLWADTAEEAPVRDPLISALSRNKQTGMAKVLQLVGQVNARRERLSLDDVGEMLSLVTECAVGTDALLHMATIRVVDKLTQTGLPILGLILRVGEAALHGKEESDGTTCAASDPSDARAVSRVLMLLSHFGRRPNARAALLEHHADTLCMSVLAHTGLPSMVATQSINVLSLMFCSGTPPVPKCRLVSKALSKLVNRQDGSDGSVGPAAMAAALELLLHLTASRSMCHNLLFSSDDSVSGWVPVSVDCAFRLPQCAQRLARELGAADERWEATTRGSEAAADAEDVLASWLFVGELLLRLCQGVLVNCPTASVFLAVMTNGAPPEHIDDATLKGVLSDVHSALSRITGRRLRGETVPLRAAALVGNLRALHQQLADTDAGPPPTTLTREELCPSTGVDDAVVPPLDKDEDVLCEIVSLFSAAADLESDPEWHLVAALDAADVTEAGWEFDAQADRKRRQAALEKAESERRAKRLKTRGDRSEGRRRPEDAREKEKPRSKSPPPQASKAETTPAGAVAPAEGQAVGGSMDALQSFIKDHPEFLRVLQNPKKYLSDPRVKMMMLQALRDYPAVGSFLAAKGLLVT